MTPVLTSKSLSETFGFLLAADLDLLKAGLIKLGKEAPIVVEVGTGAGTGTLAILEACPAAELYSIDVNPDSSKYVRGRIHEAMLSDAKVHFLIGDSRVLYKDPMWAEIPIDFFLLDGEHSNEGIVVDLQGWAPLVSVKGTIAVHDYGAPGTLWARVAEIVDGTLVGWRRVAWSGTLALFRRKKAAK